MRKVGAISGLHFAAPIRWITPALLLGGWGCNTKKTAA